MSLQDDYFDVESHLQDDPQLLKSFERIWSAFCSLERRLETNEGLLVQIYKGEEALKTVRKGGWVK